MATLYACQYASFAGFWYQDVSSFLRQCWTVVFQPVVGDVKARTQEEIFRSSHSFFHGGRDISSNLE